MRCLFYGIMAFGASAGLALAQTYTEKMPASMPEKGTAIEWLFAAIFLVGCLVLGFKPAKRANLR